MSVTPKKELPRINTAEGDHGDNESEDRASACEFFLNMSYVNRQRGGGTGPGGRCRKNNLFSNQGHIR